MLTPTTQAPDRGYTVETCKSGLGAAEALSTFTSERKYWEARIAYWREQLAFAEKREAEKAS